MKKNNKKGFTLVELVIVVAVMAVLVAVAIPTVSSITGEARDAVANSNAKTIESIIKLEEAELSETNIALSGQNVAQAIYDAKLGIDSKTSTKVFYYNPKTGTVSTKDAADNKTWKIEFASVTIGEVTAEGVSVTPLKDDGTRDAAVSVNAPAAS